MSTTTTQSQPRKPTARPTVWRLLSSKYVDLLICGFVAWLVCFAFGLQSFFISITTILWVVEWFWCRDRLIPTVGEYCLGIRYLTSSSSQVVADIQVIHNKLKLNGFLLGAGVVDLSLAILFFCGWTFLGKAVFLGIQVGPPLALVYWIFTGFLFFISSGNLLSGSKQALWVVPAAHLATGIEFFISYPVWKPLLENDLSYPPWVTPAFVHMIKSQSFFFLEVFGVWSLFVVASLVFSRKHLIN